MKHDPIELLARMAHVHATGEAGERIPWAMLAAEQREARTHEAAAMLGGLGRTSYPTNPEGLTAPADIASAAEGGLRDLQQGVTGLFEGVVQTNLRVAQELFRLANPAPLVELQQRFAREYTDTMLRNGATLIRAMRRTADETLRPLEQQIERQQREQANQNQGQSRFQTAAE